MKALLCFFFFQAEDGILDLTVTGVQTCALPISAPSAPRTARCPAQPGNWLACSTQPAKLRRACRLQALFGLFRERTGGAPARTEMFSATAARMSAFNAFSSILSP